MRKQIILLSILIFVSANMHGQVLGQSIFNWDFANGIPTNWVSGINSTTDIAHWEYRGPSMVPNQNTGGRGSCAFLSAPLSSETQSNGFVIFDGNYWDDNGPDCGLGIGTGLDPGPHTAWLITEAVDLSTLSGAVLTFQQQYRLYNNASIKVQISTDGGENWVDISSIGSAVGAASAASVWSSTDITSYILGQSNVQFKFIYQGFYYWWMLDDITIYQPNQNDLMLTYVRYTNNSGPESITALLNQEYDQYPILMIPNFNLGAACANVGVNDQNNAQLNVQIIRDDVTEVYNTSSSAEDINANATNNFQINNPYLNSPITGDYKIFFSVQQDEIEDSPENNIDSLDYSITDFSYARDEGSMSHAYIPSADQDEFILEAGCYYQGFQSNAYCHSIQVAVAEGTEIGAGVSGSIYNQDFSVLLARTDTIYVNAAHLNSIGDEKMITVHLSVPFEIIEDSLYFVALTETDSTKTLRVAQSGGSLGEASLIRYAAINGLLVSSKIPMVRMNLFSQSANPGCTSASASNFDQNADVDDGSCSYPGCSDENADNYNPIANFDDGSCVLGGCLDPLAANYNPNADYDNGNCQYPGCTDPTAVNYNSSFNVEDGSCEFIYAFIEVPNLSGCAPFTFSVSNNNTFVEGSSCDYVLNDVAVNAFCSADFQYTIETPGEYEFTYTFSINNAIADTTILIEVFDHPESPIISYDGSNFLLNCENCASNNYVWHLENQVVQGSENSSLNIFFNDNYQNGNYSISIENENGCETNSEDFLVVQPVFLVNVSEACTPLTITATDLSDLLPGSSCTIDFDDGQPAINFSGTSDYLYTVPGEYVITVTCTFDGVSGVFSIPVNVHEVITPILVHNVANNEVECTNCDLFETAEWNIDGTIYTGAGPYPDNGHLFMVTGETADNCSATALLVLETVDIVLQSNLLVYPVPADYKLFVKTTHLKKVVLSLFDITGKKLEVMPSTTNDGLEIDTSAIAAGFYYLLLTSEGVTSGSKIEIKH